MTTTGESQNSSTHEIKVHTPHIKSLISWERYGKVKKALTHEIKVRTPHIKCRVCESWQLKAKKSHIMNVQRRKLEVCKITVLFLFSFMMVLSIIILFHFHKDDFKCHLNLTILERLNISNELLFWWTRQISISERGQAILEG